VWSGGQFAPSETPVDDPWVRLVRDAASAELPAPPALVGVSYGADMRMYRERDIACVMFGPRGLRRAHAADEFVDAGELETIARVIVRCAVAFAAAG
jgi:acetylornithine deacetylase/succinyl-diaminopimelate desuccinylase-like protein